MTQDTQETNIDNIGKKMLSESKFYMGYSRWDEVKKRLS